MSHDDDPMKDAAAELAKSFEEIFAKVELVPDTPIESVHSVTLCEDGESWMIYVNYADGTDGSITISPGARIAITQRPLYHNPKAKT